MRAPILILALTAASLVSASGQVRPRDTQGSRHLGDLPWTDAEPLLTPAAVVVIPLGAGSKEHGPHLKLRSDETLAEHLMERVAPRVTTVIAPTLTYHYYPAFLEYPGSTSLSLATARDLTVDVVRSLARHGPRRFYVLNTGISTLRPLEAAATTLAADGILLRYTSIEARLAPAARRVGEQEGGSHADELETSMMLHLDPGSVDMSKAVKDFGPRSTPFALTRRQGGSGTYSPSGVWGDPTLASAGKGRVLVDTLVSGIVDDIAALQAAPLPFPSAGASQLRRPDPTAASAPQDECSPGDERSIRAIGSLYATHWANGDAERLAGLWARQGDLVHPDGYVERGPMVIRQNRAALFARRAYRGTRHPLTVMGVRCLASDVAVADGKWELRGVTSDSGEAMPDTQGLCTLVVKRTGRTWLLEAYRYTITPHGPATPTLLKRPGYPGGGSQ
ncbi:MAG TPA: SgcJ/EcaC family oxidoreductase [Vicinamibacterales bacterium]|nr:SgcJ/EcaC family oxidoreductase [Vicinamibacterales bacterium]